MTTLTTLSCYEDGYGNVIDFEGSITDKVRILFKGRNNRLIVESPHKIDRMIVRFECDNATVRIGSNDGSVGAFGVSIRIGQDCAVDIGRNVSVTQNCFMSAAEGASIEVGDDCMIASNNEIRADDSHPIFDVTTGVRINPSQSIVIGEHVWLAKNAVVMGGVTVGQGTVIGYNSIVTKNVPNNCIAVGSPAKVTRQNVAWERPGLSTVKPFYKPDASVIKKSKYWAKTE